MRKVIYLCFIKQRSNNDTLKNQKLCNMKIEQFGLKQIAQILGYEVPASELIDIPNDLKETVKNSDRIKFEKIVFNNVEFEAIKIDNDFFAFEVQGRVFESGHAQFEQFKNLFVKGSPF